jgi:dihydroorotate dehydrogenase (fumarate)
MSISQISDPQIFTSFNTTIVSSPIYNASGPLCTTEKELNGLLYSESAAILTKSCTKEYRVGNLEPRYWSDGINSINSTGLANMGYKYYGDLTKIFKYNYFNKPYIISVAGLTLDDNLEIIKYYQDLNNTYQPDAIEINLSCPNIIGKSQVAYDLESVELYLRKIYDIWDVSSNISMGFKLSPYFDRVHFEKTADIINDFSINFITCINSPGYGMFIDIESETTRIHPNNGHGGIGGNCVLPIALANVHQFRKLLSDKIEIVGCGGVSSGSEVFQHLLVGAQMVQIGTKYMEEGPIIFERVNRELIGLMRKKGYKNIEEFRGKLKYLDSLNF